jgi:hypothetical protein
MSKPRSRIYKPWASLQKVGDSTKTFPVYKPDSRFVDYKNAFRLQNGFSVAHSQVVHRNGYCLQVGLQSNPEFVESPALGGDSKRP